MIIRIVGEIRVDNPLIIQSLLILAVSIIIQNCTFMGNFSFQIVEVINSNDIFQILHNYIHTTHPDCKFKNNSLQNLPTVYSDTHPKGPVKLNWHDIYILNH